MSVAVASAVGEAEEVLVGSAMAVDVADSEVADGASTRGGGVSVTSTTSTVGGLGVAVGRRGVGVGMTVGDSEHPASVARTRAPANSHSFALRILVSFLLGTANTRVAPYIAPEARIN